MGKHMFPCELCERKIIPSRDVSVCKECDLTLIEDDKRYFAKLEATRKKRHCRKCEKVLPAGRYFNCDSCQKVLPSECAYESIEPIHVEGVGIELSRAKFQASGVTEKKCSKCKTVKPASDFTFSSSDTRDGLQSNCRECSNQRFKKWREEAKEVSQ